MSVHTIGKSVLRVSLAISIAFVSLYAGGFAVYEYGRRRSAIGTEIQRIEEAQVRGIVEGLWNYDDALLQALVDGFLFHPYISYAAVIDVDGSVTESGDGGKGSPAGEYRLTRRLSGGDDVYIGRLLIKVDSRLILEDVARQVALSLLNQVLSLAIMFIVMFLLFSRLVTRHLARVAAYLRTEGARLDAPPLALDKPARGDEIDVLVEALNSMRRGLSASREAETHAMEELRIAEARASLLIEEAPDAIMMLDVDDNRFISCNRRASELFRRPKEQILGLGPLDLYAREQPDGDRPEETIPVNTARALAGESVLVKRNIVTPDGAVLICDVRVTLIPWENRRILRVSCMDISDRVRAEEAVERSLREKEVLLREVYHRTKNNMQIIASFLNMEAMAAGDETTASVLSSMISRIQSMALVHQKLYASKDLSRIDLADYLSDLAVEIGRAYLEGRRGVAIRVEAEPGIVAPLDTAIPCGLALNELIVNAVKYAFPGGREGTILVRLSRLGPGTLALSVEDDGVGLPEGFDPRVDGHIGLQTVLSLIELQLKGSFSLGEGPGVRCSLTVRENLDGKPA